MDGRLEYTVRKEKYLQIIPLLPSAPQLTAPKARHVSLKRGSSHESFRNFSWKQPVWYNICTGQSCIARPCLALSLPAQFSTSQYLWLYHRNFSLGAEGMRGVCLLFKFSLGGSLADTACCESVTCEKTRKTFGKEIRRKNRQSVHADIYSPLYRSLSLWGDSKFHGLSQLYTYTTSSKSSSVRKKLLKIDKIPFVS